MLRRSLRDRTGRSSAIEVLRKTSPPRAAVPHGYRSTIPEARTLAVGTKNQETMMRRSLTSLMFVYAALPGFVGMHDHLFYPAGGGLYHDMPLSFPRLYLAAGVTTIRTTGSLEPYFDLELKKGIDEGKLVGPKINMTGPYLEGEGAFTRQMHALKDAEDARRTVEYWITEGARSFKAYNALTRAELKAAVDAAHKHGVKVTAHFGSIAS